MGCPARRGATQVVSLSQMSAKMSEECNFRPCLPSPLFRPLASDFLILVIILAPGFGGEHPKANVRSVSVVVRMTTRASIVRNENRARGRCTT